ncbi:MAG: ABC transporter permease [Deltaproteobacteria bacterium]|nr:ABC transporter permease [Deltaproteobacteria bacterium]
MIEAQIAFRQLFQGIGLRFTAGLTLLGVSLGVMSLVMVLSVMNGFEKELQKNMVRSESHILLYRREKGIEKWRELQKKIKKSDPAILEVLPITYNEVLFIHQGRVQGGVLEGVDPETSSVVESLGTKDLSKEGAYVGQELARKLQVKEGGHIKILLSSGQESSPPRIVFLKVLGIFDAGLYEYSSRYAYVNLAFTQKNLGWSNRVSAFKVKVQDPQKAREIARAIRRQVNFPFFIRTWMDLNRNIFIALKIEKVVLALILSAIIVIAIFNVVSSLIMIVIEKIKEISILKAMGMSRARVGRIFLWQGAFLGVIGSSLGIGLAWLGCEALSYSRLIKLSPDIYYLSYLPVEMKWQEVALVGAGIIGISLAASFYPAHLASRLFPVEGIRYE